VQAIPGIVLTIPRFMVMKELGIINTYVGMIVPSPSMPLPSSS
jgi:ABC-type glycerol-3-phosphate transport system permease component